MIAKIERGWDVQLLEKARTDSAQGSTRESSEMRNIHERQ